MLEPAAHGPSRGRILVADSEPHIRRMLTTLLESASFTVDSVADGTAALALLQGPDGYDLALLDLGMSGVGGLEVLDGIRDLGYRGGVRVVILTSKGQDTDRSDAFHRGAADFITKPFSPKKLLARIEEILERG